MEITDDEGALNAQQLASEALGPIGPDEHRIVCHMREVLGLQADHKGRARPAKGNCRFNGLPEDVSNQDQPYNSSRHNPCRSEPAAIRLFNILFAGLENITEISPLLQITPNRRHASSGFPLPEILKEHGITPEDWALFTSEFKFASYLNWKQLSCMGTIWLALTLPLSVAALPTKGLALAGIVMVPLYYHFKNKNLRRRVRDGSIPIWTAVWDEVYFKPKGVVVGFDTAGLVFPDLPVQPRPKPWRSRTKGRVMTIKQAAKQARISVVRLHDPAPEAGSVPGIEPIHFTRFHRLLDRLQELMA